VCVILRGLWCVGNKIAHVLQVSMLHDQPVSLCTPQLDSYPIRVSDCRCMLITYVKGGRASGLTRECTRQLSKSFSLISTMTFAGGRAILLSTVFFNIYSTPITAFS
jgi:hypothetical protein